MTAVAAWHNHSPGFLSTRDTCVVGLEVHVVGWELCKANRHCRVYSRDDLDVLCCKFVAVQVEEGVKELVRAEKTQKQGRALMCIIALIVMIVVMLIIIIVRHI